MMIKIVSFALFFILLCWSPIYSAPTTPRFPSSYHLIQTTICFFESIYCPAGFSNVSITSHSYYDYPNNRASAVDAYDLSFPTSYVSDQTFISVSPSNPSHLITKLYYLAKASPTEVKCFQTDYQAALPPPDFLKDADYLGVAEWNHQSVYSWKSSDLYGGAYWYSDTKGNIVGSLTVDRSQAAYFSFLTERKYDRDDAAFKEPEGIKCDGESEGMEGIKGEEMAMMKINAFHTTAKRFFYRQRLIKSLQKK